MRSFIGRIIICRHVILLARPRLMRFVSSINLGRGRRVPKSRHGMLVHRTVKLRMMEHTKYTANAIFDCEPVW